MTKTRDGIKLSSIIHAAEAIGIFVRGGTKYPYMLLYESMRPCPVAQSTDAKAMIVPWIKQIVGQDSSTIYHALKSGEW